MGQKTLDGPDLTSLYEAYSERTTERLPERARASDGWQTRLLWSYAGNEYPKR